MKRSEMLDILEVTIKDYLGEKINHPDILAQVILKDIEETGMLPPGIYVARGPFETVEYEWENEDE